nr:hypothetical protein Itr_chr07CG16700 [Ipomoea trifida]
MIGDTEMKVCYSAVSVFPYKCALFRILFEYMIKFVETSCWSFAEYGEWSNSEQIFCFYPSSSAI